MNGNVIILFGNKDGDKIVKHLCNKYGIESGLFDELVDAELDQIGKKRKAGLWDNFDDILDRMGE